MNSASSSSMPKYSGWALARSLTISSPMDGIPCAETILFSAIRNERSPLKNTCFVEIESSTKVKKYILFDHDRDQARDPEQVIGDLLGPDEEASTDRFWDEVARNLAANRLRLLFVADKIPEPLKRVAEFLNDQMPGIEVFAVEVKRFGSGESQALVPRVFGTTASSRPLGRGPSLTRELFLDDFGVEAERHAATQLLNVARDAGATFAWARALSASASSATFGSSRSRSPGSIPPPPQLIGCGRARSPSERRSSMKSSTRGWGLSSSVGLESSSTIRSGMFPARACVHGRSSILMPPARLTCWPHSWRV